MTKWTTNNTTVHQWFERDRAHVEIRDISTDVTIFELWDDAVEQFIEDGFKHQGISWHAALVDYANSHDLTAHDNDGYIL